MQSHPSSPVFLGASTVVSPLAVEVSQQVVEIVQEFPAVMALDVNVPALEQDTAVQPLEIKVPVSSGAATAVTTSSSVQARQA